MTSAEKVREECFVAMRDGNDKTTIRVVASDLARILGENIRLNEQVGDLQRRGTELLEEARAARADSAASLRKCVEAWAEVDDLRSGVESLIKRVRTGARAA